MSINEKNIILNYLRYRVCEFYRFQGGWLRVLSSPRSAGRSVGRGCSRTHGGTAQTASPFPTAQLESSLTYQLHSAEIFSKPQLTSIARKHSQNKAGRRRFQVCGGCVRFLLVLWLVLFLNSKKNVFEV